MRTLPATFSSDKWDHTLVKRTDKAAIYRRSKPQCGEHFEVLRIRIKPERKMGETVFPEGEYYPSNSEWGTSAWTYTTLEKAEVRYNEINSRQEQD